MEYTIFNNLAMATLVLDSTCKIVYFNTGASLIVEVKERADFLSLVSVKARVFVQEKLNEAITQRRNCNFEIQFSDKHYLLYVSHDNNKENIILNCFDITSYKIAENNLIQLQKIHTLGYCTTAIIHDFNNFLTAIMVSCDLIKEQHHKNNLAINELEQIQNAAICATKLVQNLSSFVKKEQQLPQKISIAKYTQELKPIMTKLLGTQIALTIDIPQKLSFQLETGKLEQLLLNLVMNARDAIDEKGVIKISGRKVKVDEKFLSNFVKRQIYGEMPLPGEYITLVVSDTGIGVETTIAGNIFEPFVSNKINNGSVGIGLTTVHDIVKQKNGYITMYTQKNVGTSFHLFFPICL